MMHGQKNFKLWFSRLRSEHNIRNFKNIIHNLTKKSVDESGGFQLSIILFRHNIVSF